MNQVGASYKEWRDEVSKHRSSSFAGGAAIPIRSKKAAIHSTPSRSLQVQA